MRRSTAASRRWSALAIVGLSAVSVTTAVAPSVAEASTTSAGPLVYVRKSAPAGTGEIGVSAFCPVGSRLAGGGGGIATPIASGFDARLTTISPMDFVDADTDADDGFVTEAYSLGEARKPSATAICLRPGKSALTYDAKTKQLSMNTSTGDQVYCQTPHTRTVGGGVDMNASNGDTALQRSGPADSPVPDGRPDDGWNWSGQNNGSTKNVTYTVVCLPKAERKARYVSETRMLAADKEKSVKAHCPAGLHVSGGGWDGFIHPYSSQPFDGHDADKAPDDGWRVHAFNSGSPETLVVDAICIR